MRAVRAMVALVLAGALVAGCAVIGDRQSVDRTYRIDETITQLVLTGESMSVRIVPGIGPVDIEETRRWRGEQPRTTRVVEGGILRINQTGCKNGKGACEVEMRIMVPSTATLDIDVDAGKIRVEDVTGDAKLKLDAGEIDGSGLGVGKTTASVDAGKISLEYRTAPVNVRAEVNAGEVEIKVPDTTEYKVTVTGGVGGKDVSVRRSDSSTHEIWVSVDAGKTEVSNS